MTEQPYTHPLEEELGAFYSAAPLSDSFVNSLKFQLNSKIRAASTPRMRPLGLRPAWIVMIVLFAAIIMTTLIIGPAKVYAEMRRLLGYIPGVGLVDTSAPIRVLAEPVEQTRDGVTITVTSATLTSDRSHIEYRVFGVPRSAYPSDENIHGCFQGDYLLLPDGSKLERMNDFPAVPAEVNEATLVIPCIAETLPGTAPENWEFHLKFIAASPDLTMMPVIETSPTVAPTARPADSAQPTSIVVDNSVNVTQVIETATGYILVGEFKPQAKEGEWIQQTGVPVFTDAQGKNVPLKMNLDAMNNLQTGPDSWVYEIDAAGVSFPITITFNGVAISQPDPSAIAEVPFDFGETVIPGQEWAPALNFELAGHTITLAGISADSQGGYNFNFQVDPRVYGLRVQIKGQTPNGGGGGGGGGLKDGKFNTSVSYAQRPVGKQTLAFSGLSVIGDPLAWSGSWSPATVRTDLPAVGEMTAGTCANATTTQSAPVLPATIKGKALMYEQMAGSMMGGLVLYDLDGSGSTLVTSSGNWGSMNTAGTKITYSAQSGFAVYDAASGATVLQSNGSGYDPVWSNAGTRYAFVNDSASGIMVMDLAAGTTTNISSLGFESTVGWLPDDSRLITAAMFSGGSAWQIRSIDPNTGDAQDLFVIEDGSYKSLSAALSPDGQWIAYRGRNNNDIHLVKLDGSENRLLLDNPAGAISGMVWAGNGWLGLSLLNADGSQEQSILVDPASCTIYKVPGLTGTLEGLFI